MNLEELEAKLKLKLPQQNKIFSFRFVLFSFRKWFKVQNFISLDRRAFTLDLALKSQSIHSVYYYIFVLFLFYFFTLDRFEYAKTIL